MAKTASQISKSLLADIEKKIDEKLDRAAGQEIGRAITEEIKKLTATGISPVNEGGRFARYKHQGEEGRYPASVRNRFPDKKNRPVNLRLSGKFIESLYSLVKGVGRAMKIEVGVAGSRSRDIELGHREGAGGQPRRPIIPERNESFSRKIQATVFSVIQKRFK